MEVYRDLFLHNVESLCNSLPPTAVEARSLEVSMVKVDTFLKNWGILDHEELPQKRS